MSNGPSNLWERLRGRSPHMPPAPAPAGTCSVQARVTLANPLLIASTERESRVVALISLVPPEPSELERLPVHSSAVLDRSSSMAGEKMQQAIEAACALLPTMLPSDLISAVAFNGRAAVLVEPSAPAPAIAKTIRAVRAGGSTNIGDGLDQGYDRLRRSPACQRRLILVSDGEPTAGDCDEERLSRRAANAREEGIITSTLGVGRNYNARLLARIAAAGGGSHRFVDDPRSLTSLFQAELQAAAFSAAADAMLTIRPSQGVTLADACPFPLQPLADGTFQVTLGDLDPSRSLDAVLEFRVPSRGPGQVRLARLGLAYRDPASGGMVESHPGDVVVEFTADPLAAARAANPEVMRRRQLYRAAGQVKTMLDANLTVPERTRQLAQVQKTLLDAGLGGSDLSGTLVETITEMSRGVQGGAGEKTLVERAHTLTRGERALS